MNQRPEHKKLKEQKLGNRLGFGRRKDFMYRLPLAQTLRLTINKWELMSPKTYVRQ